MESIESPQWSSRTFKREIRCTFILQQSNSLFESKLVKLDYPISLIGSRKSIGTCTQHEAVLIGNWDSQFEFSQSKAAHNGHTRRAGLDLGLLWICESELVYRLRYYLLRFETRPGRLTRFARINSSTSSQFHRSREPYCSRCETPAHRRQKSVLSLSLSLSLSKSEAHVMAVRIKSFLSGCAVLCTLQCALPEKLLVSFRHSPFAHIIRTQCVVRAYWPVKA